MLLISGLVAPVSDADDTAGQMAEDDPLVVGDAVGGGVASAVGELVGRNASWCRAAASSTCTAWSVFRSVDQATAKTTLAAQLTAVTAASTIVVLRIILGLRRL
jgi:hypothetical protein